VTVFHAVTDTQICCRAFSRESVDHNLLQSGEVRRRKKHEVTAAGVGLLVTAAQPQPSRSAQPWCISPVRGHGTAKQLMDRAMEVDDDCGCSSIRFLYFNNNKEAKVIWRRLR